jgi:hypothetical protein
VTEAFGALFWHFWHLITLEVFEKHMTTYPIWKERRLLKDEDQERTPWLNALSNPGHSALGEAEQIGSDVALLLQTKFLDP